MVVVLPVTGGGDGMKGMDGYESVRRCVVIERGSRRAAARLFGMDRKTVDKCLAFSAQRGYRPEAPRTKPKLGPFLDLIDAILRADADAPPKQRHSAKRIWERLRDEHGYAGGYDRVKEVVRERGRRLKEAFVPLAHPRGPHGAGAMGWHARPCASRFRRGPCHHRRCAAQGAFLLHGPSACGRLLRESLQRGARTSGAPALKPAETTEAFLDGHVSAFAFFGGVPRSILYDNTKIAPHRLRCGNFS